MELEEAPEQQKGITTARSIGHPVDSLEELEPALATYTARAAEKLWAGGQLAGHIQVHLETSPFRLDQPQHDPIARTSLPEPSAHTPAMITAALILLRRIYRPGFQYKKVVCS